MPNTHNVIPMRNDVRDTPLVPQIWKVKSPLLTSVQRDRQLQDISSKVLKDPLLPPEYFVFDYDDNLTGWGVLGILRDENIDFARRLMAAGVSTELHVLPGLPHGFEMVAPDGEAPQRVMANRLRRLKNL
jgi:acetyl esterase/lipase